MWVLSPDHTKPTVGRQAVFVRRPIKFSQCVPHRRLKLVLVCFFPGRFDMLNRRRSSLASRAIWSFWLAVQLLPPAGTERYFFLGRHRTDVLLGHRVSSIGLVCQGNFGPRRCRCEPTPQSAFVATSLSVSAWCVPAFKVFFKCETLSGWNRWNFTWPCKMFLLCKTLSTPLIV